MPEREQKPDHSDPGGRDTGAGYPEEQPPGANPGVEREGEGDAPSGGSSRRPDTDGGRDGKPGQATGNPGAAGGDVKPSGD